MASRQELEAALVKADRAGDTRSAKILADEIRKTRATPEQMETANPLNRWAQGVIDPAIGIAQNVAHAVDSPVVQALKQEPGMSNLPFVGGMVNLANAIPTGVSKVADAGVAASEKKYQDAREATGNKGMDWMRVTGNLTTGLVSSLANPAGLVENVALGGAMGATTPVSQGNFATEKAKQVAVGGVLSGAVYGLGKLAKTAKDKFVDVLTREGIRLTPGQASGGFLKSVEDRLTSLPIVGDAIKSSRKTGLDEFNRAAYKHALDPIGESIDDIPVGREAIAAIGNKLSTAYDDVLPLIQWKPTKEFANELSDLAMSARNLPPDQQSVYRSVMQDLVLPKVRSAADGRGLKEAEEILGKKAATYMQGQPGDRELAAMFREVQSAIRENLIRTNPKLAPRLQAIDEGWKAYNVLAQAGMGARAAEGFTPNALSNAVKAANKSYRKRGYSRGEAFMQDLSDAAQMRLPSEYPDSGTAGRMMLSEMAGLGASPLAIPYLPGLRGITSSVATQGVPGVSQIGGVARKIAPFAPGANASLYRLLYENAPESD